MIEQIFSSVCLSFLLGVMFRKIGIPYFCAFITTGFLFKKIDILHSFNFDFLSKLGILFLLFSLGLEMSIRSLKSMRQYVKPSLSIIISITLLGFFLIKFTGDYSNSMASNLALTISLSSTAIVLLFLIGSKQFHSELGKTTLSLLIIQDIVAMIILLIVQKASFLKILIGISIFGVFASFLHLHIDKLLDKVYKSYKELFFLLVSIFLFGFSALSNILGLSEELGVMCAGMILANSRFTLKIEAAIGTIKELFLMFFFMEIGHQIDISIFKIYYLKILLGLFILLLIKILGTIIGGFAFMGIRNSLVIGLISCNISETGFLIIKEMFLKEYVTNIESKILTAIFLGSILISPLMILFAKVIQKKQTKDLQKIENVDIIIHGTNIFAEKTAEKLKKLDIAYLIVDDKLNNILALKEKGYNVLLFNIFNTEQLKQISINKSKMILFTEKTSEYESKILEIKYIYPDLEMVCLTTTNESFDVFIENNILCVRTPGSALMAEIIEQVQHSLINNNASEIIL